MKANDTLNDSALGYHDFPATSETLSSLSDTDTVEIEHVPIQARAALKSAASLRPGESMMIAAAQGNKEAQAVRDAWRFSIPVRTVTVPMATMSGLRQR
jgi:hypothetical protein